MEAVTVSWHHFGPYKIFTQTTFPVLVSIKYSNHLNTRLVGYSNGRCVQLSNGLVFEWWFENWTEKVLFMVHYVWYLNGRPSHVTLPFCLKHTRHWKTECNWNTEKRVTIGIQYAFGIPAPTVMNLRENVLPSPQENTCPSSVSAKVCPSLPRDDVRALTGVAMGKLLGHN